MAKLIIEDLKEDKKLDEKAMKAIAGGAGGVSGIARAGNHPHSDVLEESKLIRGLLKARGVTR